MKWVLVVWTIWMTGGHPTVDVKHNEVYYPSKTACETAMFDMSRKYQPYTEEGFGYTLTCMEREVWERRQAGDDDE